MSGGPKVMARLDSQGRVKGGCMTHDLACAEANGFKPPLATIDADQVEDDVGCCSFCGGGPRVTTGKYRSPLGKLRAQG
jgi:hypothetical protein